VFKIVHRVRCLVAVYRTYHGQQSAGSVIVIDSNRVDAFATPAPAGRVVVTSALLRALNPTERRAVLAHEHSHLAHRHVWWAMSADLAAAVNPLLRPTATAVGHAIERWADEDAATVVGDRHLVARTIARAALLRHDAHGRADALLPAATGADVPLRVRALLAPPPRRRPLALAALAVLLAAGTLATVAVERSGDQLFDHALLRPAHSSHHHLDHSG
jgi:Zn-dependent protease with chaperone function